MFKVVKKYFDAPLSSKEKGALSCALKYTSKTYKPATGDSFHGITLTSTWSMIIHGVDLLSTQKMYFLAHESSPVAQPQETLYGKIHA